jgi:hypothetical protein
MATLLHAPDILQKIYCAVLPPGAIFDEAGNKTIFLIGCHNKRWHFCLTKSSIGF